MDSKRHTLALTNMNKLIILQLFPSSVNFEHNAIEYSNPNCQDSLWLPIGLL